MICNEPVVRPGHGFGAGSGAKNVTLASPAPGSKDPQALQYSTEELSQSRLVELETLEHPEGRLRSPSIDADRPGRSFESAGVKRHAMSREFDPKKQEAIAFAKQVAERLESARHEGEMERLISCRGARVSRTVAEEPDFRPWPDHRGRIQSGSRSDDDTGDSRSSAGNALRRAGKIRSGRRATPRIRNRESVGDHNEKTFVASRYRRL